MKYFQFETTRAAFAAGLFTPTALLSSSLLHSAYPSAQQDLQHTTSYLPLSEPKVTAMNKRRYSICCKQLAQEVSEYCQHSILLTSAHQADFGRPTKTRNSVREKAINRFPSHTNLKGRGRKTFIVVRYECVTLVRAGHKKTFVAGSRNREGKMTYTTLLQGVRETKRALPELKICSGDHLLFDIPPPQLKMR